MSYSALFFVVAGLSGVIIGAGLGSMVGAGFEMLYGVVGGILGLVFLYFGMRVVHLLDLIEDRLAAIKWPWKRE